jgi:hypothetical protein
MHTVTATWSAPVRRRRPSSRHVGPVGREASARKSTPSVSAGLNRFRTSSVIPTTGWTGCELRKLPSAPPLGGDEERRARIPRVPGRNRRGGLMPSRRELQPPPRTPDCAGDLRVPRREEWASERCVHSSGRVTSRYRYLATPKNPGNADAAHGYPTKIAVSITK